MSHTLVWNLRRDQPKLVLMGNRDALLLAAKSCLLEKGYLRTTARDIASSAGVSLAAIGYHFSSKEALLTEALLLAFEDWDQEFRQALEPHVNPKATPAERFESTWAMLMETFATHRSLWVANFELFSQLEHHPEIRRGIVNNLHLARRGLAALFLGENESAISRRTAETIGTFHHVLLTGLIAQWLIDPGSALSARALTEALRSTAAGLEQPEKKSRANRARRLNKSKQR
jgi:AcrR family transcriptional regulator